MLKERKWIIKEAADPAKAGALAAELGIDRVLAELLVKRGVETFEQARSFFRPSLDNLHDPFLMTDMDAAVERVRMAIMMWMVPRRWPWSIPSCGVLRSRSTITSRTDMTKGTASPTKASTGPRTTVSP